MLQACRDASIGGWSPRKQLLQQTIQNATARRQNFTASTVFGVYIRMSLVYILSLVYIYVCDDSRCNTSQPQICWQLQLSASNNTLLKSALLAGQPGPGLRLTGCFALWRSVAHKLHGNQRATVNQAGTIHCNINVRRVESTNTE